MAGKHDSDHGNKGLSAYIMDDITLKPVTASVFAVLLLLQSILMDAALCRPRNIAPCSGGTSSQVCHHVVKKGETLFSIAKRYDTTVESIQRANGLAGTELSAGHRLVIPQPVTGNRVSPVQSTPAFRWPLKNVRSYTRDGSDGVRSIGIIIVGREGATVRSSAPGVVLKIGSMRGFGTYIVIRHGERYSTVYSHLDSVNVSEGDHVEESTPIGCLQQDRLHFQIDRKGRPMDPLVLLPRKY